MSVFVLEISTSNKSKRCKQAKVLTCDENLRNYFRECVTSCIAAKAYILQLNEINTTQDNRFFYVEKAATDFPQVLEKINPQQDQPDIGIVTDCTELNTYNAFIVQLSSGDPGQFRYSGRKWRQSFIAIYRN